MIYLFPAVPTAPAPPIQNPILRTCEHAGEQRHRRQRDDRRPPDPVHRRIARLEELAAHDAGRVGGHDEDGQGDGAFAGGAGVEGHPGAVDGVCSRLLISMHTYKQVAYVSRTQELKLG